MNFLIPNISKFLGFIFMIQLVGLLDSHCLPFCKQENYSDVAYDQISAVIDELIQYEKAQLEFGNNFDCFIPLCNNAEATDASPPEDNSLKLELLQILFRQGDRLPEQDEVYPTDPHKSTGEYEQVGYGRLTEGGKARMTKLGELIRKRYGEFLGDYSQDKVSAYSSDHNRTIQSLDNVLRGLYPDWSSVDVSTEVKETGFLTRFRFGECEPKFYKLVEDVSNKPEVRGKFKKYMELLVSLSKRTGWDLSKDTAKKVLKLYHNIKGGMWLNLTRPEWCTDEVLHELEAFLSDSLDGLTTSQEVMRISAGPVVKKFMSNLENKDAKKLYLYSGHDINLSTFTRAHNFTETPKVPDFGNSVVVEKLRGKDGRAVVRMFYWTGGDEKLIPLKFEDVGYDIPLDTYKKRVEPLLPHADDCA